MQKLKAQLQRLIDAIDNGKIGRDEILVSLPETADGMPVIPYSQEVFHPEYGRGIVKSDMDHDDAVEFDLTGAGDWRYSKVCDCYSTQEKAETC